MALPVALQLYSIRDAMEADFVGTLRKVKEMGYDGVEFAGLFGHTPDAVNALCKEIGLIPISAHVPIVDMIEDSEKTFSDYEAVGCKYAAIPHVDESRRPNGEKFEETVQLAAKFGEVAKKHGIQLLYHNHDFEFRKLPSGEYGIDYLYRNTPAEYLQTEFDTCWVNFAGENPAEYVIKYSGRAPVVHLKDFYQSGKLKNDPYALIGVVKEEAEEKEDAVFEFRPVGYGVQNMPSILDASVKTGAEWVVVEQDNPSLGLTSMECAKLSRDYLRVLGW